MLNRISTNTKIVTAFFLGIVIASSISVTAASIMIDSATIAYNDNGNVSNVKEALDTLYNSVEVTTITPVGSILPYIGTTAPTNYLICDGSEYNITDYKKLADFIKDNFGSYNKFGGNGTTTFKVPDLRGEFLRGAGKGNYSYTNGGSSVGTHQNPTREKWIASDGNAIGATQNDGLSDQDWNNSGGPWNYARSGVVSGSGWISHYTSRPTNTSVNYIIKVK